jgi:hypothetical protein
MRRTVVAAVAVFFVAVSGSTMIAQAQGAVAPESEQQQCEREGGYWDSVPGVCEVGAQAKATVTAAQQRECERNNGWWDSAIGSCEVEAKLKAK